MSDVIGIDSKRKPKRCEICGGAAHETEAACPRVYAITYEADGGITYHLNEIPEPPDAA
jgi:hypothetical protein